MNGINEYPKIHFGIKYVNGQKKTCQTMTLPIYIPVIGDARQSTFTVIRKATARVLRQADVEGFIEDIRQKLNRDDYLNNKKTTKYLRQPM
ncbi:hypothetical protein Dtox_3467 [Desulfofarcimen acetoxidans DSM 771]|jgi:hypothetical protein|uniref:Uncharacterized protein n=1 Tax=Desulfofarcimen acetoxidans (strain ATCC 49208 / DSM 771 / KCTC 5769 / VKM B-1644 / 5575) TaxID=485916 RepID=C8W6S8_DESAS|nr:hypothetical protein Dtox_3467 [Desulfofarcimen acetoxidans DSM 771]